MRIIDSNAGCLKNELDLRSELDMESDMEDDYFKDIY